MNKRILLALAFILSATSAGAEDYRFVQKKRSEAAKQRMMLLQQLQHKQANPTAFLDNMDKQDEPQTASFKAASNGHYYVPASINGRSIKFIADTGATSIFLTQNDARKVGINVENLNYSKVYNTANGQIKAAETQIPGFKVGGIEMANVPVTVSPVASGTSLLGMAFFSRLSRYSVENGTLTLYK